MINMFASLEQESSESESDDEVVHSAAIDALTRALQQPHCPPRICDGCHELCKVALRCSRCQTTYYCGREVCAPRLALSRLGENAATVSTKMLAKAQEGLHSRKQ